MRFGLRDWAMRDPERVALIVDGDTPITYAALEARANRLAHLIGALGLGRGDHVAALLGNGADAVALVWGAYRAGVYLTPLPTSLTPVETAYVVVNSEARLVLADARFAKTAAAFPTLCPQARVLSLGGTIEGVDAAGPHLDVLPDHPRPDENPGALMMYSSGTTGAPKGILRPLPASGEGPPPFAGDLLGLFALDQDTRYLSTQPLYHAAALRFVLAISAAGGLSVVMPRFDAARALALIDTHGLTLSQWVPVMFRRLLALSESSRAAFNGSTHARAIHGAAPITPALKRAMIDWWGPIIEEYYSGSEGVGLTAISSTEWLLRPGSVGRAKKGVLHILASDDDELPPGRTGRVFFSGVPPFAYFNEPEKTAGKTSRQGWQTFGDIGHVDDAGYLFLTDRQDDMIISGGVNLYPAEIETALEEAPFIAAAGVIGAPDIEFDERPVAFVVPKPGETDVVARLRAHIETRLGRLKHPRDIHVVDDLPWSENGKLLRRSLRAKLAP